MTMLKRALRLVPYFRVLWGCRVGAGAGLFDRDYYRASCPSQAAQRFPLLHFLLAGGFERRNPHPLFDTEFYLRQHPELADTSVNPLAHYLKYGVTEERQPHPLFDPVHYLACYPDVRAARVNPLLHFVRNGAAEGRKPHPLFQPEYYLRSCPDARRAGANPLVHFLEGRGANWGRPHPLFDCDCYLKENPDVAARGVNPLVSHVLTNRGGPMASQGACQIGWGNAGWHNTRMAPSCVS
jgi:hypothetical protein